MDTDGSGEGQFRTIAELQVSLRRWPGMMGFVLRQCFALRGARRAGAAQRVEGGFHMPAAVVTRKVFAGLAHG
jgi:hypothetical protein